MQRIIALFSDPAATGWVYDNQDLTTMFQDVAGTVPVTAPGQRVRLQLDKSGKGDHRRQPSGDASAPILGRHPAGGRRNLLTWTEDLTNVVWTRPTSGTGVAAVVTQNFGVAPDGTLTAIRVQLDKGVGTAGGDFSGIQQGSGGTIGQTTGSVWIRTNDSSTRFVTLRLNSITSALTVNGVWQRISVTEATTAFWQLILRGTYGTSDTADLLIWRPQLEPGSTATPYQRVTIADDCTEAGVADRWYLRADGADDWLETSAFAWGSDKATVVAGVRKLSDAVGDRVIAELSVNSDSNNGAFRLGTNAATFTWRSRGTVAAETSGAGAQPISAVLTGIGDISGDSAILRVNSTQVAQVTTDQGTGNFGTYPAYFFRRGGTSSPFNGFEYANIGINRLLTPADLALVEGYVTGVTL